MKPDHIFRKELEDSEPARQCAADLLEYLGHDVVMPEPGEVRPDGLPYSKRKKYADKGDLFVDKARWEVKGRKGKGDFDGGPFPFKSIIVCEKYTMEGWEEADNIPERMLIFNSALTHYYDIDIRKTRITWGTKYWSEYKRDKVGWICPIPRVTLKEVPEGFQGV